MSADPYVGDLRPARVAPLLLRRGSVAGSVVVAGSSVAAAVHLAVAPEHLDSSRAHAAFFVALAVAQAVLAWVVGRRPSVHGAVLGLVGTVGVILLYVASRTVGLPASLAGSAGHAGHGGGVPLVHQPIPGTIGPGMPVMPGLEGHPGVEAVGTLDLIALSAELAVVVGLLALLPPRPRTVAVNVLLVVGMVVWAMALWLGGAS